MTFSTALIVANRRMFWNVRAMPSVVILSGRVRVMSLPSKTIHPIVGLYRPVSMLKNVVLPAPLGPMIETIERSGIEKETSLTATRPPKIFETCSASSSVARRRRRSWRGRRGRAHGAPSTSIASSAPMPSVSSSFRRRSGSRPCGRSTIMSTMQEAEDPEVRS